MDTTIQHLTDETYAEAASQPGIMVIDFWAGWCGAALAATVSTWFLLLTALVGVNQWLYVLIGACPASIVLRRTCHLRSAIYTNPDRAAAAQKEVTV
jgi:hypothetical protein